MKKVLSKIALMMSLAVFVALAAINIFGISNNSFSASADGGLVDSGLNYTETTDPVYNPGQGFYKALSYIMQPDNAGLADSIDRDTLTRLVGKHPLLHINFGLEATSQNMTYINKEGNVVRGGTGKGGSAIPITAAMLTCLDNTMNLIRDMGFTTIVRFTYNVNGYGPAAAGDTTLSGSTYVNAEPTLTEMQAHIAQLAPFFTKHKDIIESVDAGILGPWGEMHTTSAAENVTTTNAVINALLDAVPSDRCIGIRYPVQYARWYSAKYNKGWTTNAQLEQAFTDPVPQDGYANRINMFNDGYLANSGDMGTFKIGRAKESQWINKASTYATYGGEAIVALPTTTSSYAQIEYFAWEGFVTHTSHLNIDWNAQYVIKRWQQLPYRVERPATIPEGEEVQPAVTSGMYYNNPVYTAGTAKAQLEELYVGQTAFRYIENRLGYRLVVRESANTGTVSKGGAITVEGKIENMGFGNIIRKKTVTAILAKKDGSAIYETDVTSDIDVQEWTSRNFNQSNHKKDFGFDIQMPSDAANGVYDIYLKINNDDESDPDTNMRTIRFANNDAAMWNSTLGANKLGTVVCGQGNYVDFYNDDGSYLGTAEAQPGGNISFSGTEPVSTRTNIQWNYNFDGWGDAIQSQTAGVQGPSENKIPLSNLTANYKAYAQFNQVLQRYTVTFLDSAGETLGSQTFDYGTISSDMFNVEVPDWFEDIYKYSFKGWVDITGGVLLDENINITADYERGYRDFKVTFVGGLGSTFIEGEVEQEITYGQKAVPPVFKKEGYIFIGWSNSMSYLSVSGEAVMEAVWIQEYTLPDNNDGGGTRKGCRKETNAAELVLSGAFLLGLTVIGKRRA